MLFRSLASSTQTPRPSGAARSITRSASRSSARGTTVAGKVGVASLPRAEVERLVAEQHVVGAARASRATLRPRPGRPGARRAPTRRAAECAARPTRPRRPGGARPRPQRRQASVGQARTAAAATAIARNGARKIRCRDSGAAEPPSFATRNAATVVPTRQRTSVRPRRRNRATPTPAATRTPSVTGHQPAVASPGRAPEVAQRRLPGPPSFSPPPPTPTSNRAGEHEVGEPERDPEHERRRRLRAQPPGAARVRRRGRRRPVRRGAGDRTDALRPSRATRRPRRPSGPARRARARGAARACSRATGTGRGCTSGRRRRGRGTASSARRAPRRRARPAGRRGGGREPRPAAGSRARTPPRRSAGRRARSRDARRAHASRKWSGAPPRSRVTCSTTPGSESRPTNSASVSSSCGGQAMSWWRRKAPAASATPPTPSHIQFRADARRRPMGASPRRGPDSRLASIPCAIVVSVILAGRLAGHADLRVPLPERPHVRGLSADERPGRHAPARRAARAPWRSCCSRSRCTSRARGSTRPTTVAAAARGRRTATRRRRLGRQRQDREARAGSRDDEDGHEGVRLVAASSRAAARRRGSPARTAGRAAAGAGPSAP